MHWRHKETEKESFKDVPETLLGMIGAAKKRTFPDRR